jgi:hypothetical protein
MIGMVVLRSSGGAGSGPLMLERRTLEERSTAGLLPEPRLLNWFCSLGAAGRRLLDLGVPEAELA